MGTYMDFAQSPDHRYAKERLVVLLDRSGSMDEDDWEPSRLQGAIEAGKALIDAKARIRGEDEVAVVAFSSQAGCIHPLVRLKGRVPDLKRSLATLSTDSTTNITAGLSLVWEILLGKGTRTSAPATFTGAVKWLSRLLYDDPAVNMSVPSNVLCRIVLLTDGAHNNAGRSPVSVARQLKNAGVIIDCVGIGGGPEDVDEKMLKKIASVGADGRPRYAFIGDNKRLIRKFEELANYIRPA